MQEALASFPQAAMGKFRLVGATNLPGCPDRPQWFTVIERVETPENPEKRIGLANLEQS